MIRTFKAAALALATLSLAGCLAREEPPLRVATNMWPGYESLYLARSLGYFGRAPIRLVELTSATEVARAMRNGTVEAAALTLDEALGLMQDGVDLKAILVMDVSNGSDALLAKPGIDSLSALKGKRVGVENGATGAVMLDAALHAAALESRDINVIPIPVNEHLAAWRAGKVDALVTFEPVRTELLPSGAQVLFDSSQIPGRIIDVLVVRSEVADAHRQQLSQLLASHFAALGYLSSHPHEASQQMTLRLKVLPQQVLSQLAGMTLPGCDENHRYLAGDHPELMSAGHALAVLMLDRQLLKRSVDVAHLADSSFLPECHR